MAISLHAPTDELRNKLMPVNKVYNIDALMGAIKEYLQLTSRRVTIEYVMLNNVNDSIDCAKTLAKLLKGLKEGLNVTIRREFGSKIDGACGQLRGSERI